MLTFVPTDLYFKCFPLLKQQQYLIIIHLPNGISELLCIPGVSKLLDITSLLLSASALKYSYLSF